MKQHRLLITIILFVTIAACATVPITGRKQLSFVPQSSLISMSAANYREFMKEHKVSRDRAKTAMVRRVGERVVAATERYLQSIDAAERLEGYEWEFALIDNDEVANAFAMPGGKVVVYTGILPITQDEAGLAAVVAHEIAHVLANHGGERMSQLLLVNLGA